MKKIKFILLVIALAFMALGIYTFVFRVRLATGKIGGSYDPFMDMMICKDEFSCHHEVGHWKDDQSGMPSQTPAFHQAVDGVLAGCRAGSLEIDFLLFCVLAEDFPQIEGYAVIDRSPVGYGEIYAQVYAFSLTTDHPVVIPEGLQAFYR